MNTTTYKLQNTNLIGHNLKHKYKGSCLNLEPQKQLSERHKS